MLPLLGLCLGALAGGAPSAPSFPGVLDMNGQVAYVASEGGIDAVGLERGDLLWRSRVAQRPLAVAGGRLFALGFHPTNQLSVVSFDLRGKGERVLKTEVTDLPRWVATQGSPSQTFRCDWRQQGGELLIDWQAEARGEAGPAKRAAGQLALDLEAGQVSPVSPVTRAATELVPDLLQKHALRWHGRAGGQLLAVALEDLPGAAEAREQRLVFRTWDAGTGKPAEPRELLRGGRLVVMPDLDGKRLWLRDAAGPDDPLAPRLWSVVSALDGHLVARVPFVPGTRSATLAGRRAYCVSAAPAKAPLGGGPPRLVRTLHAVDLDSGKVVWSRPLGDHSGQRSMTR